LYNKDEVIALSKKKKTTIRYEVLQKDYNKVLKKLEKYEEVIVLKDEEELFVIQGINGVDEQRKILGELLEKVGKKVFVEYYNVFKEYDKPEDVLPAKFSIHSRRNRSNAAKKIFELKLESEALLYVIESNRIGMDVKNKAEKLYKKLGLKVPSSSVKIGYMAKHVIPMIISDSAFDEEVDLYCDKEYSKEVFGLYFPLLQELEFHNDIYYKKSDSNKYTRYYSDVLELDGREFLLCSQWMKKLHLEKLENWIYMKLEAQYQNKSEDPDEVFYEYLEYLTPELKQRVLEMK
jgi:hypothetical protein